MRPPEHSLLTRERLSEGTRAVGRKIALTSPEAQAQFGVARPDLGGYNEIYATFLDEAGPTRTTVAVHQLPHPHLLIEMSAIAHIAFASSAQ